MGWSVWTEKPDCAKILGYVYDNVDSNTEHFKCDLYIYIYIYVSVLYTLTYIFFICDLNLFL